MLGLKIVNKVKYELMEKMVARQDNYIEQIKQRNLEIEQLNDIVEEKCQTIRTLTGTIGGLKASNNRKEKQKYGLFNKCQELEEELSTVKGQLKFYKKYGKSNSKFEKAKNYIGVRKECEKRAKVGGLNEKG